MHRRTNLIYKPRDPRIVLRALALFSQIVALLLGSLLAGVVMADFTPNYDEAKVLAYVLPDPLVSEDGEPIEDATDWRQHRRPEIRRLFETQVFGRSPGRPEGLRFEVVGHAEALDGDAIRKQVVLYLNGYDDGPKAELLIYLPADAEAPTPVFLGLNFGGNHRVHPDPGIRIPTAWMRQGRTGVVNNRATEVGRGRSSKRWAIDLILQRGYAVATVYAGDFDPDFDDGFRNGVHALTHRPGEPHPGDAWGALAAWAWGLSRVMDYFEIDPDIDASRVAVMGHSRLGKAALWAGATDERFAMVISNNSGCGGAALSRRAFGETVARMNEKFPHWFCGNFKQYGSNEANLPADQHQLLALIAPRPLYVASAEDDRWADPRGEFLACVHATPVYRLLGADGLPMDTMPAVDQPVMGTIGYHIRSGKHDVKPFDWRAYLDFADLHLHSEKSRE